MQPVISTKRGAVASGVVEGTPTSFSGCSQYTHLSAKNPMEYKGEYTHFLFGTHLPSSTPTTTAIIKPLAINTRDVCVSSAHRLPL